MVVAPLCDPGKRPLRVRRVKPLHAPTIRSWRQSPAPAQSSCAPWSSIVRYPGQSHLGACAPGSVGIGTSRTSDWPRPLPAKGRQSSRSMKVRTLVARHPGGAITPKNDWRLYAENAVAPLRRKSGGAITPETKWLLYAGNSQPGHAGATSQSRLLWNAKWCIHVLAISANPVFTPTENSSRPKHGVLQENPLNTFERKLGCPSFNIARAISSASEGTVSPLLKTSISKINLSMWSA